MKIYAVVSGKGGVGKTTVAINLSYAFAHLGKRTCLIDMNFTTPHVATMLSFSYDKHLLDYLKGRANELETIYPYQKFWIMPSPLKLESLEDINIENLQLLRRNLGHFDHLIIDSAPGFGKESIFPLSSADSLILVVNPTYSSLVDALKVKQLAERLGKEIEGVVINKSDQGSLTTYDVEKTLSLPVIASIPFDKAFIKAEKLRLPASAISRRIREKFIEIASNILNIETPKPSLYDRLIRFFTWKR